MGVNAFMFFKMKVFGRSFYTRDSGSGSGSSLQDIRGEQAPLLHESPRMFSEAETQCGAMAGGPVPAIQIHSMEEYEASVRFTDDILVNSFNRQHPQDNELQGFVASNEIKDDEYFQLFEIYKPISFLNLTIFRGVMRINDFLKIGKVIRNDDGDERIDAFISISPKTVFRFYDDDGNDILIDGFTTNYESTWTNNHLVLGNVFKEHLQNNYALKSEIPNDLINETTLTTKLNDYVLKTDLNEYRNKNNLKYVNEKHLTISNNCTVLEFYEDGHVYTVKTTR